MPPLKNLRHESFCQNFIMHRGNATRAYFDAYGDMKQSSARANASRLLTLANIQSRISELLDEKSLAEKAVESLIQQMDAKKKVIHRGKVVAVVRDNRASLKALQICLKLEGIL